YVGGVIAPEQDAAENGGMQCLDSPSEDGRITGKCFNGGYRVSEFLDKRLRSACGNKADVGFCQFVDDGFEVVLVVNRNQGTGNLLCGHVLWAKIDFAGAIREIGRFLRTVRTQFQSRRRRGRPESDRGMLRANWSSTRSFCWLRFLR